MNNNPSQIQIQKIKLSILKIGVMFMLVFGFLGIFDNAQAVVTDLDSKIAACQSSEDEGEQCLLTLKAQCGTGEEGNNCRNKIDATIKSYFPNGITAKAAEANAPAQENALLAEVNSGWGKCPIDVEKCLVWISYALFYSVPSLFLALIGKIFNILVITSLAPNLYGASFIANTWTIVRDISNIFFILILLYTGIKTILGMGSSETKSVLANVVIMAILINFSMFFSKVIIDTSNVVALVFYDKITIELNKNGQKTEYNPLITDMEKDLSGGFMAKADPTKLLSKTFFENIERKGIMGTWEETTITGLGYVGAGAAVGSAFGGVGAVPGAIAGLSVYAMSSFFDIGSIPDSTLIGIILVVGAILIAFGYALFISSISFLGRLIELWILIIFSPFAFMSFSIPSLAHMDYIGWDNWSKRIISASFMAPIFMFFLYFIYEIINTNLWIGLAKTGQKTGLEVMVLTFLPGIMIAMLILEAADFAKKGSGQFGEMAMSGFKLAAGLALGAVGLGVATAGKGLAGKIGKYAVDKRSRDGAQDWRKVRGEKLKEIDDNKTQGAWSKKWDKFKVNAGTFGMMNNSLLAKTAGLGPIQKLATADGDYERKMHVDSELDEKTKELHPHNEGGYKDLGTEAKQEVIDALEKDALSKFLFNRKFDGLKKEQVKDVEDYLAAGWKPQVDHHGKTIGYGNDTFTANKEGVVTDVDPTKNPVTYKTKYMVDMNKTNATLGEIAQLMRKGSWDPRGLHELTGKSGFNKAAFGTVALVAAGVRMGIKKGGGVEYGTPQKDFYKGIGDVISSALKNVKINIDAGGGGGGGDHGKGGGDHGGGGGHH